MRTIHVLTRKEEIVPEKLTHCTAIIIDVLLATTTIATALHHGVKQVIPALDRKEALALAADFLEGSFILSGEKGGYPYPGFCHPDPFSLIQCNLAGKTLIYATTNGTVAIRRSSLAKEVYTASLINGAAVARQIAEADQQHSVLIVCAGSEERFALEDFLGAGYVISELLRLRPHHWSLTDAAQAAADVFAQRSHELEHALAGSNTGALLKKLGYAESIPYAALPGILPVVPLLVGNGIVRLS
ncbi:MAG: 2-phosphosulfolactate phosphatase [Clostridia bacterium]